MFLGGYHFLMYIICFSLYYILSFKGKIQTFCDTFIQVIQVTSSDCLNRLSQIWHMFEVIHKLGYTFVFMRCFGLKLTYITRYSDIQIMYTKLQCQIPAILQKLHLIYFNLYYYCYSRVNL